MHCLKRSLFMCFFNQSVLGISISSCIPRSASAPIRIRCVWKTHAHGLSDKAEYTLTGSIDNLGLFFGPVVRPENDVPLTPLSAQVLIILVILGRGARAGHRDGRTLSVRHGQRARRVKPDTFDFRGVDTGFSEDLLRTSCEGGPDIRCRLFENSVIRRRAVCLGRLCPAACQLTAQVGQIVKSWRERRRGLTRVLGDQVAFSIHEACSTRPRTTAQT